MLWSRGGSNGICDDSTKDSAMKKVMMVSKTFQNCMTSFTDDPWLQKRGNFNTQMAFLKTGKPRYSR